MLSQRPEDLPEITAVQNTRSLQDIPGWVRSTHIGRLPRLMQRLFKDTDLEGALDDILVQRALNVAQAHGTWPWDWQKFSFVDEDSGLAAMLAVADLLDEDALRCDSSTLLRHRYGTPLNCAHWIRHGLTLGRVLVREGNVAVRFGRPPRTDAQMEPVFAALRNHYRLVKLYVKDLGHVNAALLNVECDPPSGLPQTEVPDLERWWELPEFRVQSALVYRLLESFMPEALLDEKRLSAEVLPQLHDIGITAINLTDFYRIRGELAPRTEIEQTFDSLINT